MWQGRERFKRNCAIGCKSNWGKQVLKEVHDLGFEDRRVDVSHLLHADTCSLAFLYTVLEA